MQETLKKIKEFIKNHWGKMLLGAVVIGAGFAIVTNQLRSPLRKVGRGEVRAQGTNKDTIVKFDPDTPPVPGAVTTNKVDQPQLIPGQQPSPTATAVTINGNVNIENLNLAIAVGGGTAATSTIEKHWYDMPPTRIEPMLDNDGGKKVVGPYEDVVFTKPEGWGVIPEVVDAKLDTDFYAMKNKGTREKPQWVDAANYHYPASEFRVRSLKYPIKVRFVLMPKD
jgi:hypothetical protein